MRGLYAILDPAACLSPPLQVAERILQGGCAVLQLRDKHASDGQLIALGRELVRLCRQAAVPFVINDRYWLAHALDADGVHVGQSDASLEEVRREVPSAIQVGVSTHSLAQALEAAQRGADLIGFGPVFATQSKPDADPVVGLEGLREVCQRVRIPVVAIGGIDQPRAALVAEAGAPLAAAISAVCRAPQVEHAAAQLHAALGGSPRAR